MKKVKTNNTDALFESICDVGKKYEISREKVMELFVDSVNKVLLKIYPEKKFKIEGDANTGKITYQIEYEVIDNGIDDYDDFIQIPLDEAKKIDKKATIGSTCLVDFDIYDPQNLSKQQIVQIMQIFKQRLNELNNIKVYKDWLPRVNTIILADVDKYENRSNSYLIDLKDGNFGFMSKADSIPGENLIPGNRYQFLIKEVKEHSKGWPVILSRADERFVLKILEDNIPEIGSGEIVVEVIKRIAGFKTKVAVRNSSLVSTYDPAAVVVGSKGNRIKNLSNQINGEKIEIVKYSDDLKTFLLNLCGNNLVGFKILMNNEEHVDEKPHITLVVDEQTLPVIIGKKGFNIKLIANMLDATVDIHTVEQAKALNIDYELVDQNNNASKTKTNDKYNKPKAASTSTFKTTSKQNNINKVSITNEELLDDIDSLSEDEIKKLFNIDIQTTTENENQVSKDDKNNEEFKINEFEDSSLLDAFSDEIANINLNDKKENK